MHDCELACESVSDVMRRIEAMIQQHAPRLMRLGNAHEKMRAPIDRPRRPKISEETKRRVLELMSEPDASPFAVARQCGIEYNHVRWAVKQAARKAQTQTLGAVQTGETATMA